MKNHHSSPPSVVTGSQDSNSCFTGNGFLGRCAVSRMLFLGRTVHFPPRIRAQETGFHLGRLPEQRITTFTATLPSTSTSILPGLLGLLLLPNCYYHDSHAILIVTLTAMAQLLLWLLPFYSDYNYHCYCSYIVTVAATIKSLTFSYCMVSYLLMVCAKRNAFIFYLFTIFCIPVIGNPASKSSLEWRLGHF